MKKNLLSRLQCARITFTALVLVTSFSNLKSAEVCDWSINTCPENLDGQVITVPRSVVALSSNISTCDVANIFEGYVVISGTPAIMFVVDNSLSMTQGTGAGRNGNDREGTRYTVTRNLLDSIYAVQPEARIGLVVFREVLYFDQRTHDILVPLTGVTVTNRVHENQAYLPPLQLNGSYTLNGTTMTGIEIIRFFLQTRESRDGAVELVYNPQFSTTGYTNINNAFDAALQGLLQVPVADIPLEQRFIVFLSDGEPQNQGSLNPSYHGGKDPYGFMAGTNTPTTFTVFLNDGGAAPDSMERMTENIRNNGFSSSNPKSAIWTLRTSYEDLMSLFMNNILQPILSVQSGYPTFVAINNDTSAVRTDSSFVFSNSFALNEDSTRFTINVSYHLTDQATGRVFDSTTYSTFTVIRRNAQSPSDGELLCRNRDINLYHNGSPVTAVTAAMSDLQVVFSTSDPAYKSVSVQVSNMTQTDQVNLSLSQSGSGFSGNFIREIASPVTADLKLQHGTQDSIIIIYRNPDIPLDTIRKSYPFSGKILSLNSAIYFDRDADGFVDSIFTGITGEVTPSDLSSLQSLTHLPSARSFQIQSVNITDGGLAWIVREGSPEMKTYTDPGDVISMSDGILASGNLTAAGSVQVQDRVAPVLISAQYIISAKGDSISVIFSEPPAPITSVRPFLFSRDGTVYQVTLEQNGILSGNQYTARISSVQSGFSIKVNDLVWINPPAMISDTKGNAQTNENNRKVPITVKEIPYEIITKIINNPFRPEDQIPEAVKIAYSKSGLTPPSNGLTIVVEPTGEVLRNITLSGTVSIYDVVKNSIIKDKPGVYDLEKQKFYFAWDGLNSNGRKVATGTYIAVVNVFDNQKNIKDTKVLYLGVRR